MKERIPGSIVKSNHFVNSLGAVTGKIVFPDMNRIRGMTLEQLVNLSITKVQWREDHVHVLGFTLSDGQTCKAGNYDYNGNFDFPADKKIVKVEVIKTYGAKNIGQIIFYSKEGVLSKLGSDEYATGTRDTFLIGDDERLIGCELEHGANYLMGVTFMKWTIA